MLDLIIAKLAAQHDDGLHPLVELAAVHGFQRALPHASRIASLDQLDRNHLHVVFQTLCSQPRC